MNVEAKEVKNLCYAVVESNGTSYSVTEHGGVYYGSHGCGEHVDSDDMSDAEWFAIQKAGLQLIKEVRE